MASMVRKQLYLTTEQNESLRQAASRERRTEAEVLRDALNRYLVEDRSPATSVDDDALWDLVGAGECDDSTLSEHVDDVLYGAESPDLDARK